MIVTCSAASHAAIVFEIRDTRVVPGQVAKVGVYVKGTNFEPLEAYNLPIDVGGNGRGFPDGLSFAGEDILNDDFAEEIDTFGDVVINGAGPLPLVPPFDPRFEAVFSDNGDTIMLTPDLLHLFNILLDIPDDFTGSLLVSISDGGLPDPLTVVSGTESFKTFDSGVLEVVAGSLSTVPEPGSAMAGGLLAVSFMIRRRRSSSANAQSLPATGVCWKSLRFFCRLV